MRAEHHEHRLHTEPVVLEIGGELGALVVYTDAVLLHEEIEISPPAADERRSPKDVLQRPGDRRPRPPPRFHPPQRGAHTPRQRAPGRRPGFGPPRARRLHALASRRGTRTRRRDRRRRGRRARLAIVIIGARRSGQSASGALPYEG